MLFHVTAVFFTMSYAILLTFLPKTFPHKSVSHFYFGVFLLLAIILLLIFCTYLLKKSFPKKSPLIKKYLPFYDLSYFEKISPFLFKKDAKKVLNLFSTLLVIGTFLSLIAFSFHKDFLSFEKEEQYLVQFFSKNTQTHNSSSDSSNQNAGDASDVGDTGATGDEEDAGNAGDPGNPGKNFRGIIKSDHSFNGKYFVLRLEPLLEPPSTSKNSSLKNANKNVALIEIRTKEKPRWLIAGVETEVYFSYISWLKDIRKKAPRGYVDYLIANKIAAIGYTSGKNFTFVKDHASFPIRLKRNILFFIEQKANRYLSADVAALVMALMSGEKNHLAYNLRQNFINSGTYHILAISGLHVGLWISLFLAAFQLLKIPLRFSIIFIVLFILPFLLFLSDFPISAIRAYGLAFLGALLFLQDRSSNLIKLITVFFFIFLFSNHHGFYAIYFLSFQLSYGAVFAIFLVLPHLQKEPLKNLHFLSKTFVITLTCQIATLPFILYAFGHLHFLSFLYNFVAVPVISFFLLYTLLFLLSPFNPLSYYLSNGVEMVGQFLFLILNPSTIDHPKLTLDLNSGAFPHFFFIALGLIIFGALSLICLPKKKFCFFKC